VTPRRLSAVSLAVVLIGPALAGCGSQVDPDEFRAVNYPGQAPAVAGDTSSFGTNGSAPAGTAPGSVPTGSAGTGSGAGAVPGPASSGAPGTATQGGGDHAPGGGAQAASCAGFHNQTGITDDKIVIANVSDLTGPVPGLFQSSLDATNAYVAYFNATSDICGRKLEVLSLDSRTDAAGDQQAYVEACDKAFAAVGSMSGFDNGGAATADSCGIPDIRSTSVYPERLGCSTCFGTQSTNPKLFQNAVPDRILKNYPAAAKAAAVLYINAGAAAPNAKYEAAAMQKRGMNVIYLQGIDISEFNYAPYVQQMKDKGVRYVQFVGPISYSVRLAQAMQQQSFKPDVFALDQTAYNPEFVDTGGDAVEGTKVFLSTAMFEEAGSNPEMQLYLSWLHQVNPNANPTVFGLFSWSAARLFVEQSLKLGGRLDRPGLVQAMSKVDNWTGNGLHSPQHVGSKQTAECWRWITLKGGQWVPDGSAKYSCSGVTKAD